MVLKAVVGFSGGFHQLGLNHLKGPSSASPVSKRLEVSKFERLECGGICMKPIDNENATSSSSLDVKREMGNGGEDLRRWHSDLASLPRPLSATDFSVSNNGSNMRIAFQGSPGAFSESAALKAYPECVTVPCEQFEVAFKAVELRAADRAVLPIENTFSGSVHRNYDLLFRHRLHIVNEVQLSINYCLMALPGVRKEDIKRVLSHPLALDQCEMILHKLGVVRENADDTASAAQTVSSNGFRDTGAIASSRAASLYGLNVLEEGIQDCSRSVTRFLILARQPILPQTDRLFKTSIVFILKEGPGCIFKALSVFSLRNINLTKIETRPQRKRPLRIIDDTSEGTAKYFDYLFYIDFEASMAEVRAQRALSHLQEFTSFLRMLGSYPLDVFS